MPVLTLVSSHSQLRTQDMLHKDNDTEEPGEVWGGHAMLTRSLSRWTPQEEISSVWHHHGDRKSENKQRRCLNSWLTRNYVRKLRHLTNNAESIWRIQCPGVVGYLDIPAWTHQNIAAALPLYCPYLAPEAGIFKLHEITSLSSSWYRPFL